MYTQQLLCWTLSDTAEKGENMKKRILLITILASISIITLYLVATITPLREPLQNVAKSTKQGIDGVLKRSDRSKDTNQPDPWKTWIDKQVDIAIEEAIRMHKEVVPWELHLLENNIEEFEKGTRLALKQMMDELKDG